MIDTCPRDRQGFCLVNLISFCGDEICRHESKTHRDKLAIMERARQKQLRKISDSAPAEKAP